MFESMKAGKLSDVVGVGIALTMVSLWWLGQYTNANIGVHVEGWKLYHLITYSYIHVGYSHLLRDSIYFIVIVALAYRQNIGILRSILIWHLCALSASIAFLAHPNDFNYAVGSSSGTHGLLAFICIYCAWKINIKHPVFWLTVGIVAYLIFMSVFAIFTRRMPWPNHDLANAGTDHLAGILTGIFFILTKKMCVMSRP